MIIFAWVHPLSVKGRSGQGAEAQGKELRAKSEEQEAEGRGRRVWSKEKNAKLNKCDCRVVRLHDNSSSGDRTGKPKNRKIVFHNQPDNICRYVIICVNYAISGVNYPPCISYEYIRSFF